MVVGGKWAIVYIICMLEQIVVRENINILDILKQMLLS